MTPEDRKKQNLRLALILASVAVALFVGFIAKAVLLGR
ncbi:cytochrome oxidase small assembly protein [Piscinibacter sp. XHJ-5]|nr:cytochrome oxidase small assembly protein [Piscinibacter sp. XHJ-5]